MKKPPKYTTVKALVVFPMDSAIANFFKSYFFVPANSCGFKKNRNRLIGNLPQVFTVGLNLHLVHRSCLLKLTNRDLNPHFASILGGHCDYEFERLRLH